MSTTNNWNSMCSPTGVPHRVIHRETNPVFCPHCGEENPGTPRTTQLVDLSLDDTPPRVEHQRAQRRPARAPGAINFPSLGAEQARMHRQASINSTRRQNPSQPHAGSAPHSRRPETGATAERLQVEINPIVAGYCAGSEGGDSKVYHRSTPLDVERCLLANTRVS